MSTAGWTLDKTRQIARFWSRTRIDGACIVWTGATRGSRPYGLYRETRAHRWIYEQAIGAVPDGLVLRHACDNRLCVALQHLEPGTQAQNMAECVARDRKRPTAARGADNGNHRSKRSKAP